MSHTVHLANAWHPTSGGIRTFYLALLEEAERLGRQMAVITPGDKSAVKRLGRFTRWYCIKAPRVPCFDRRYRALWPHRFLLPMRTEVWRILERERPDIIDVSDKYSLCHLAGLVKRRTGPRPTVIGVSHERLDDSLYAHLGRPRAVRAFSQWYLPTVYLRQFDAHLANSEYTATELRTAAVSGGARRPLLWRLRDRIFVRPLGADTAAFAPALRSDGLRASLLRRLGGGPEAKLVVFAGRLSADKFVCELVPALRMARDHGHDLRLVIAGDGPMRATIERDAAEFLPGQVLLLGHVGDRHALAELLASADSFLHPNPREPFGIGPLEAMASGTPVVVPRSGGVLTYAREDNAWLARPGCEGLARALGELHSHPAEAAQRAQQALRTIDDFAWPGVAKRYFETYDLVDQLRRRVWASQPLRAYGDVVDHFG